MHMRQAGQSAACRIRTWLRRTERLSRTNAQRGDSLIKKPKMPKLKDVANAALPRSYLIGWFSVGAKGGSAEAGQLADKWLKKNGDKLKEQA